MCSILNVCELKWSFEWSCFKPIGVTVLPPAGPQTPSLPSLYPLLSRILQAASRPDQDRFHPSVSPAQVFSTTPLAIRTAEASQVVSLIRVGVRIICMI